MCGGRLAGGAPDGCSARFLGQENECRTRETHQTPLILTRQVEQAGRIQLQHGFVVLVVDRPGPGDDAQVGARRGGARALHPRFQAQRVAGRTGVRQRTSPRPGEPNDSESCSAASTAMRMVSAQVCQPLAIRPPQRPAEARWGSVWNHCGSYLRANSRISASVTVTGPALMSMPSLKSANFMFCLSPKKPTARQRAPLPVCMSTRGRPCTGPRPFNRSRNAAAPRGATHHAG